VPAAGLGEALEAEQVDVVGAEGEAIAGGAAGETFGADGAADAGDERLQGVGGGGVVLPDGVEEGVRRDLAAGLEGEAGDERPEPRAAELDGPVVGVADLEGSEKKYAHVRKCAPGR
jgi:hypothetical protein